MVLGRIQIIKSFVIPVFMYRAGLVCPHKEIVKEQSGPHIELGI